MNDATLLAGVVHAMGLLVAARDEAVAGGCGGDPGGNPGGDSGGGSGGGGFAWVGRVPGWAERFGCATDGACDLRGSFAFLDFFLEEAEAWWGEAAGPTSAGVPTAEAVPGAGEIPGVGVLRSEVWAEPDRDGVEHQLEAVALRVGGQGVVAIAGVGLEFSQARSILQTARERRLAMDRELAVRQLVEDQLRQRVAQRTAELDQSNRQLRSLASEVALAEQRERHRLAIGLHDHIGQLLAVTKMRLASETARQSDAETKQRLGDTVQLIGQAIDATRSLTFELSPPMLYEMGLVPTLASLVEQTASHYAPLACEFEDDGQPKPLPTDVQVLLFQVARELITNTLKHAEAGRLEVRTERREREMVLVVKDDGRGFDPALLDRPVVGRGGFGLLSVRERLAHFGATMQVDSRPRPASDSSAKPADAPTPVEFAQQPERGTTVRIVVPLESD